MQAQALAAGSTHDATGDTPAIASIGGKGSGFSLGDTLFYLSAVPSSDHSIEELETAVQEQLNRLQTELPTADELERVRAQILSGEIYQQASISRQANQIGRMEAIGRTTMPADSRRACAAPASEKRASRKLASDG